jgi:hypothetical protein
MNMNLSYSLPQPEKMQGAISTRSAFFRAPVFLLCQSEFGDQLQLAISLRRTAMKKSYLFAGLLLGSMLPTVALCTPNVTGKWSGTLQMDGESDAKPAYSIFNQDENKLSGSVGPNESGQDWFEGGKVDGDKLTFDVPQGPNGEGSIHVEMQVKGDQMTGRATWSGPPPHSGSGKISLKRVVEK